MMATGIIRMLLIATFLLISHKVLIIVIDERLLNDPVQYAIFLCIIMVGLVGLAKVLRPKQ